MGQERPRRGARSLGLVSSPEKREPPPTQQSREAPLPGLHFCIPPSAKSTGRTGLGLRDPRGGGSQASLSTNCEKNGKAWNADLNRSRWVFFPTQWESIPVRATHTAQLGTQGGRLGLWSRHGGTRAWVTGTPTLSQDTRDKDTSHGDQGLAPCRTQCPAAALPLLPWARWSGTGQEKREP